MSTAAAVYARISEDVTGEGLGVARQQEDCRALAERRGWEVVAEYIDNDVSAFSGKGRPQYEAMLEAVREGTVDAIVVWHPDRLHRSPRELEDFIDLIEDTDTTVATCTAGDFDLATPEGRMVARITGTVARKESEDKSRRLKRKALELAQAGKVGGGGLRPFGFESDRKTVLRAEAKLVQEAASRLLLGESLYAIVNDWTDRGVETSTGVPWSTTSLKSTLTRGRIAGLREHNGEIVGEAEWDAILDEVTWKRIRAVLTDPSRRQRPRRKYLMTGGLARCGICGEELKAAPRHGGARAYACIKEREGCGGVSTLGEPFEDEVVGQFLLKVDWRQLRIQASKAEHTDTSDEELQARIAEADERLQELEEMWVEGDLDRAEWLRLRQRLRTGRQEAEAKLTGHGPSPLADLLQEKEGLEDTWYDLSLDRQRAILDVFLHEVRLHKIGQVRNRFDPDRVELRWRV